MARYRFQFWLDCDRDDELMLAEAIDDLKRQRAFVATVRDGIRLVIDLRRGKLDVLFALFPWVRAEFLDYMQSLQPDKSAAEARLEQQIARLERLMLQPGGGAGPRPMALQKVGGPVPVDDDDAALLTITRAKVDGKKITQNFINSMMRLQQ